MADALKSAGNEAFKRGAEYRVSDHHTDIDRLLADREALTAHVAELEKEVEREVDGSAINFGNWIQEQRRAEELQAEVARLRGEELKGEK